MSENGYGNPPGGEPTAAVYRRRRLFALLLALLLLVLLIWGLNSLFKSLAGPSQPVAATVASSTAAEPFGDFTERGTVTFVSESATAADSSPAPASPSQLEASGTDQTDPAQASPSQSGQVAACTAENLQVLLTTDHASYSAGQNPNFVVSYSNKSQSPCAVGGQDQKIDINITSGIAQVYNHLQCHDSPLPAKELKAGESASQTISWDRSINVLGCENTRSIEAGYYWATAVVNGVSSEPVRVIVSA